MLVYLPRKSIEVAGTRMGRERLPLGERGTRGFDCCVDILSRALCHGRHRLSNGWIVSVEVSAFGRRLPGTTNEVHEAAVMTVEPDKRLTRIFQSRAVFHGDKFFDNAHSIPLLKLSGDDARRSSVRWRGTPVDVQYRPASRWHLDEKNPRSARSH